MAQSASSDLAAVKLLPFKVDIRLHAILIVFGLVVRLSSSDSGVHANSLADVSDSSLLSRLHYIIASVKFG